MQPWPWRVTTTAGHQLHAVEWGPSSGATGEVDVLLVHGLASNARLWDDVAAGLADLGHRVVAYDQRGHGQSERAADGFPWDGVVADLVDVVTALGLESPVVVGQSWGGNVVLQAAADAAGTIRGAMTVDGGFFDLQAQFDDADAAWAALTPPPLDGVTYDDVRRHMAERFDGWPPAALRGQLANFTRTRDGSAMPALRRDDHERVVRSLWEQRPVQVAERAAVPVLLGPVRSADAGDSDRATAVAAVRDVLPRGRVHWFDDADHDVHAQRPDEVVAVLRDAVADAFWPG